MEYVPLKVVSASRRTDMVAGGPDQLTDLLELKYPPQYVHTLVIWTKNPENMFSHTRLNSLLIKYQQIYVHFSITGLGGTVFEPHVPSTDDALRLLPRLVDFVKSPARINLRFDPIVHFEMPDGRLVCNIDSFEKIALAAKENNITDITTSWVEIYGKVKKRLEKLGICAIEPDTETKRKELDYLLVTAHRLGLVLHGCCVPEMARSRCINGELFNKLHPEGLLAGTRKARGQRILCGCTESIDIGWYYACPHGCVYCYGNPELFAK